MMAEGKAKLDTSTLRAFEGPAAGHDGVLLDASGELFIKPCTQAEVDFYQRALIHHSEMAELMPTFMGTLQLGASSKAMGEGAAAQGLLKHDAEVEPQEEQRLRGSKLTTETAIVLQNLEHGFTHPNVLDIKLGAKLYKDGTPADKAARLDKISGETTSGSLHFRIAGMKVWNGQSHESYDKLYGRQFVAGNVKAGFETFFAGLSTSLKAEDAAEILEMIVAEIAKVRHILEKSESRFFSSSLLVMYEGDSDALNSLLVGEAKTRRMIEKAPTLGEVKQSVDEEEEEEEEEEEDDDDDDKDEAPVVFRVKLIDFAHAQWTPGKGQDENVIIGLKNIEEQMDLLISRLME